MVMTGLFGRPADPLMKENAKKAKEFKKLVKGKRYDEAIRLGTEYLRKVPHNQDVLFTMGGIYHMRGMHRAAISYLDKALEIGSYDTDALLLKARSHRSLGETKRTVQCCKKIQEVDPKNAAAAEMLQQAGSDL